MKSFIIGWNCNIKLSGSWTFLIFDPCKLLVTELKAFSFFRIETKIIEIEFSIGEVFTDELSEIIFIFWGDIVFIHGENEFVDPFFSDREEKFVVLFDSDKIFGFVDNFSKEPSLINFFNEEIDFILIRKLSKKKLFEIGNFDGFLLLNILKSLWGI